MYSHHSMTIARPRTGPRCSANILLDSHSFTPDNFMQFPISPLSSYICSEQWIVGLYSLYKSLYWCSQYSFLYTVESSLMQSVRRRQMLFIIRYLQYQEEAFISRYYKKRMF